MSGPSLTRPLAAVAPGAANAEVPMPDARWPLLYLCAPAILFVSAYLNPLPVKLLSLPILLVMLQAFRVELADPERLRLAGALPCALLVAWIAGMHGGPYAWDWIKHWALVNELATHDWPVSIELDGVVRYLRFYVGLYLVPAAVHKVIPAAGAAAMLAIWVVVGYVLVFRLTAQAAGSGIGARVAPLALLALGGADFFVLQGFRLAEGLEPGSLLGIHYDKWPGVQWNAPLEYSSILTALVWVPHQSVPTWLVAGLIAFRRDMSSLCFALLGFGALALWSPFGMIGTLPLLLLRLAQHRAEIFRPPVILGGLVGGAFAACVVAFLSSELPASSVCLSCLPERYQALPAYLIFLGVELVVFGLILGERLVREPMNLVSFLVLLVIPFVHGDTADFVMRASLGPIFVLSVSSVRVLTCGGLPRRRRIVCAIALCLSVPGVVSEAVFQRRAGIDQESLQPEDPSYRRCGFAHRRDYSAREFLDICGWEYLPQYFSVGKPPLVKPAAP